MSFNKHEVTGESVVEPSLLHLFYERISIDSPLSTTLIL